MKILSIECSAVPCSVAITENGKVIASAFANVKLTHSETLMPMAADVLKNSKTDISDIDGFAVASGPGSFTGVRIGISAVKGLAAAGNKKCVGVSSLRAMAQGFIAENCIVCAVMDARCNQVYNALFKIENGSINALCPDRAIMCDDLKREIAALSQSDENRIITVGDGAELFYGYVKDLNNVTIADSARRYQNAVNVGLLAEDYFNKNLNVSAEELLPVYLRLPQAERELKQKKEQEK